MKNYLEIESIEALEVLDSRGNPTVQVTVELIDIFMLIAMKHIYIKKRELRAISI